MLSNWSDGVNPYRDCNVFDSQQKSRLARISLACSSLPGGEYPEGSRHTFWLFLAGETRVENVCAPRRLGGERSPRTLLKYHRHAVTLISGQLLICQKCQCVFCSLKKKKKGSKKSTNRYYLMDAVYCLLYENYVIDFPWPWMKRALLSMAFLAIILLDCTRLSKIH